MNTRNGLRYAATGAVVETRYKAWGEVRYTTPNMTLPTRNTLRQAQGTAFTGQYSYIIPEGGVSDEATDLGSSGFGLMFYNARWYDPYITQFSQPDSIVPTSTQGTQAWDRYAGMNNNPVRYNDPSGHQITLGNEGDTACTNPDPHICQNGQVAPYAGIYYTLQKAKSAQTQNEKAWYSQRAIFLTSSQFGIYLPSGHNFVYGGADPITYGTTDLPNSPDSKIFDLSFSSTPGDLAATMSHESCHQSQGAGTSCLSSPQTIGERYYSNAPGYNLNEIEANDSVLMNLGKFAYGTVNGITQDKVNKYNSDNTTWIKGYTHNMDFMNAILNHIYILPPGYY